MYVSKYKYESPTVFIRLSILVMHLDFDYIILNIYMLCFHFDKFICLQETILYFNFIE